VHISGLQYGPITLLSSTKDPQAQLKKLKEARKERLSRTGISSSNDKHTCTCHLVPDSRTELHGYHRQCYQRFTMNLNRLSTAPDFYLPSYSKLSQRDSSVDKVLFTPDCIFCNSPKRRKIKIKVVQRTESV